MSTRRSIPKLAIVLLVFLIGAFFLLEFDIFPSNITENTPEDTTPPVISCNIQTTTVLPGETLSIEKLGVRATDSSEIKSIAFTKLDDIEFFSEEFQFSYGGRYNLTIRATDIHDNFSDYVLNVIVETPPEIDTPSDFYVATGSAIDYSKYVSARDLVDEDFSFENLTIDSSEVNIAVPGNYPVSFSGIDSYGLKSSKTATIHVLNKDELQKQIDSQKINISDFAIIGATNAYDIGVYSDKTLLEAAITPSLVTISNNKNDSLNDGFIIRIDNEFVTIAATASGVSNNLTVDVHFFDETTRSASVVFTNEEYDLAFIRLPIDGATEQSSVSSDYIRTLRTVHLDKEQWEMHPVTKAISLEQLLRHYELVFKYKLQK